MDKKYAIPITIIVGVVVIYYALKTAGGSKSTTSTINRLIPVGENNTQQVQRDASRVAAFSNLSQVAGQQIAREAQAQSEAKQFEGLSLSLISGQEIERIKSGLQRELGLQQLEAFTRQIAGQEESDRVLSADRRYDIDQQLVAIQRGYEAQKDIFNLQATNSYNTLMAQINAVGNVGREYRGQSLERQGTILNALSAIWGQPGVYNYQSAFGKAGVTGVDYINSIGNAAGNILKGLFV